MTDLASVRERAFQAGYRMLGNRSDAEDVAQETVLRVHAALAAGEVRSPEAYATTVATRLAIDHLRSARVRREAYRGPWLPEPIIDLDVEDQAEVADSVSYALLVVLERLAPVERAAFLLREAFGFDYAEVAAALDRSEPATRQLVHRARRRLASDRPRLGVDPRRHRELLDRFLTAATTGDVDGLRNLLTDDVRLVSDGGAAVKAARRPILGRDRVARFLLYLLPRLAARLQVERVTINGGPGFVLRHPAGIHLAGTIEADGDRIAAIHWVLNPEKLPSTARNEPPPATEGDGHRPAGVPSGHGDRSGHQGLDVGDRAAVP